MWSVTELSSFNLLQVLCVEVCKMRQGREGEENIKWSVVDTNISATLYSLCWSVACCWLNLNFRWLENVLNFS